MIEQFITRILRAVGFAIAAAVGLTLIGFDNTVVVTLSVVIAFLFVLGVLTYWAATCAALLLIWGALVSVGMLPDASYVSAWGTKARAVTEHAITDFQAGKPLIPPVAATAEPANPLAKKLSDLKEACDKGLMPKDECDAARAKITEELLK